MNVWFVTGTDTDAGKTLVTSSLLYAARQQQLSTLGLKPVASGSDQTSEGLRNDDAVALQQQSVPPVAYATINPIAFAPVIAPHLAAKEAGQPLEVSAIVSSLSETLSQTPRDITLIEGAGGWRVPLNDQEDFADLAIALELPVILVVGLKLGCLNHARLTAEAIRADGLVL
ncbi:MAG: dethiobiotin synthase, partial [Halomonas sp.]|nr:dethiobiotin synthase [Halomonas sp.]